MLRRSLIIAILLALALTSCSLIRKPEIEQGNIIEEKMVNRLHTGMNVDQVVEVMGTPVLVNIFSPNRMDYVYTYQSGNNKRLVKRVTCLFKNGRLSEIRRT